MTLAAAMHTTPEHHYLMFADYIGNAAMQAPESLAEAECWREAKAHLRMARAREREEVGI